MMSLNLGWPWNSKSVRRASAMSSNGMIGCEHIIQHASACNSQKHHPQIPDPTRDRAVRSAALELAGRRSRWSFIPRLSQIASTPGWWEIWQSGTPWSGEKAFIGAWRRQMLSSVFKCAGQSSISKADELSIGWKSQRDLLSPPGITQSRFLGRCQDRRHGGVFPSLGPVGFFPQSWACKALLD